MDYILSYLTFYVPPFSLRGVMEIWKAILQKTEELGKRRGSVADLLQSGIAETLKEQKRKKEQLFKRHFEVAQKMISEVLETVKDLTTVSVFTLQMMDG